MAHGSADPNHAYAALIAFTLATSGCGAAPAELTLPWSAETQSMVVAVTEDRPVPGLYTLDVVARSQPTFRVDEELVDLPLSVWALTYAEDLEALEIPAGRIWPTEFPVHGAFPAPAAAFVATIDPEREPQVGPFEQSPTAPGSVFTFLTAQ